MPESVFDALHRRMDFLTRRQSLLAQNVANADTPGYRPMDLRKRDFDRLLPGVRPAATHPAHIDAPARGGDPRAREQRETWEASPTGNAVVLEEQLVKVAETQSDYRQMTNLYRKHAAMFMTALGRGGR